MSFFVIGIPRSGTTLLEKILDNHSQLGVCPESTIFKILARLGIGNTFPSTWHYQYFMEAVAERLSNFNDPAFSIITGFLRNNPTYKGDVTNLLRQLGDRYLAEKRKFILGEKTPEHLEHLPLITKRCPNAKFIFILRNPLDIVCSMSKLFARNKVDNPYTDDLILKSAAFVKRGMQILYHKNGMNIEHKLFLKYEDLVQKHENELQRICNFLRIPYEDQMINFNAVQYINGANKMLVNTHKNLNKPINDSQVDKYLKAFSKAQIKMVQLFLEPELALSPYSSPCDDVKLHFSQKTTLLKHQILFHLKIETVKEYYIRFKISVKYFLFRLHK